MIDDPYDTIISAMRNTKNVVDGLSSAGAAVQVFIEDKFTPEYRLKVANEFHAVLVLGLMESID